jgi:hypothetical protein
MKKYFLFFAAGGFITLASCGSNTAPIQTLNIDSIAQVKVDSIAAVEKAKSDSMVTAQAVMTADSLKAVMKADSIADAAAQSAGKNAPAKKVIKTKAPKEVTPPPPPPKSDKENKLDKMRGATSEKNQEEIEKSQETKSSKLDKMRGK